ncbi:MAG: CBS domain-containing protein, partial [Deltaproteobacteria bacterium]|nr:CBS domain-containing protein [Deltaproteobacteria bacterium]
MQIRDIMTRDVQVVDPDASLRDAAELMEKLDIGLLPVCDGERLVGMLTDRDMTVRATAKGLHPEKTCARDVMTPEAIWCYEDQDVEEAAALMEQRQIRRLPILNRDKRLVGFLSLGDLAVRSQDRELAGEAIKRVSEPAEPN